MHLGDANDGDQYGEANILYHTQKLPQFVAEYAQKQTM